MYLEIKFQLSLKVKFTLSVKDTVKLGGDFKDARLQESTLQHICTALKQWSSDFRMHQNHLEGFLQQTSGSCPEPSDSIGLGGA